MTAARSFLASTLTSKTSNQRIPGRPARRFSNLGRISVPPETKTCYKCNETKHKSDFYDRSDDHGDGLQHACKSCVIDRRRKYRNNPENYQRELAGRRAFRKNNPEHVRAQDRRRNIKQVFGITQEEFEEMLKKQNGVCAICGKPESVILNGKVKRISIDHCKKTGKICGLLCSRCNRGIGNFNHDHQRLLRAAKYCKRTRAIHQDKK